MSVVTIKLTDTQCLTVITALYRYSEDQKGLVALLQSKAICPDPATIERAIDTSKRCGEIRTIITNQLQTDNHAVTNL